MKFYAKWSTYSSQSCWKILASISEMRTLKFSACSWAFPISFGWEEFEFFSFLRNFSNLSFQKNSFSFHPMSRTHLTKAPNSQSKATRMYSVGSSCHGHPKLSVWKPLSPLLLCLQRDLKCHHCIRRGHKTGRILQHAFLWNGKPPPKKENTWAFFFEAQLRRTSLPKILSKSSNRMSSLSSTVSWSLTANYWLYCLWRIPVKHLRFDGLCVDLSS